RVMLKALDDPSALNALSGMIFAVGATTWMRPATIVPWPKAVGSWVKSICDAVCVSTTAVVDPLTVTGALGSRTDTLLELRISTTDSSRSDHSEADPGRSRVKS